VVVIDVARSTQHLYMPVSCINTAIDPTYFINAYGQNPTSQKSVTFMGLPWVPELVRISNRVPWVSG